MTELQETLQVPARRADEAGQTLRPPKARTWARRGRTPVFRVSGKGSGRASIAGIVCYRHGDRGRFVWRTIAHRGRKGERSSFAEADYPALLDRCRRPRTRTRGLRKTG